MAPLARMIGCTLLTGALGGALAHVFLRQWAESSIVWLLITADVATLAVTVVAGLIGAVIGAALEIVMAMRQK